MATDELARLGQQVVDVIVSAYLPADGVSLALAFHPGQAIADHVVQEGVTNPLVLSQWIADQYDYPMLLRIADSTRVPSPLGDLTAKEGYLAMVPWATPALPADSAGYPRVAALIATARQSLGSAPDTLPFGCEPDDFAEPASTGWQVFDTVLQADTTDTSTITPTTDPPPVRANPELWRMRSLPDSVLEELPQRVATQQAHLVRARDSVRVLQLSTPTAADLVEPAAVDGVPTQREAEQQSAALVTNLSSSASIVRLLADSAPATAVRVGLTATMASNAPERAEIRLDPSLLALRNASAEKYSVTDDSPFQHAVVADPVGDNRRVLIDALTSGRLRAQVADQLASVEIGDLTQAPAVTQTTTESSTLHVHFEYQLLHITRRLSGSPWWRDELVSDKEWYVPAMRCGDVFDAPQGDATLCLPRALIVVRNVAITGQWTEEASQALHAGVTYIGPFLAAPPTDASTASSSSTQLTVLGTGTQVIGELCTPLPSLPPLDDPAMTPTEPDSVVAGG